MHENVTCENCGKKFLPNKKQLKFLEQSQGKGMRFAMIDCLHCGQMFSVDPVAWKMSLPTTAEADMGETTLRCPVSGCTGWVSFIEDESEPSSRPFWGCGESGSIWYERKSLNKEISAIIKKFAYRKHCYVKVGKDWEPNGLGKEPKNYEEFVEKEPKDNLGSFVRG